MADLTDSITTSSPPSPSTGPTPTKSLARPTPVREDCWSEDATFTLIEAWGRQYLELSQGNLRQKHWQEIADAVNARHAHLNKKAPRTDVQCKNRIDTLKKKYKIDKARVLDSHGSYHSDWPFFATLDSIIGSSTSTRKKTAPASLSRSPLISPSASVAFLPNHVAGAGPPMAVPLLPYRRMPPPAMLATVVPLKRPSPVVGPVVAECSNIRNNYSAVAAAAAAAAETDEEEEDEVEEDLDDSKPKAEQAESVGLTKLARAIETFGEVYARVETDKQRQIVELEKQRMQFAKELECQRMQMLVEMQVQLEKVKRVKRYE